MSATGIENKGIDGDFFNFLCHQWESAPIHQTMDLRLIYLGPGEAGIKIHPGREYTTIRGRLHGGISAALADTAMGWAILTLGRNCVTVDMYTNYIAPAFGEHDLTAEAQVVHSGNRTVVAEATLCNGRGELVAKSRGTFSLKRGKMQAFEQDNP
ncbi:hypothetical protein ASZ90_017111 [hydrocarbon metagenome]|uniref:Thioesterase domain-containing protein n=1 Tax=hydrocarbon metagenome TaxID=938273 RepID=A0A0W8EA59_9ZZZZ